MTFGDLEDDREIHHAGYSSVNTSHKLELSEKTESQLRKCCQSMWLYDIYLISD